MNTRRPAPMRNPGPARRRTTVGRAARGPAQSRPDGIAGGSGAAPTSRPVVSRRSVLVLVLIGLTLVTLLPFAQAFVRQQQRLSDLRSDVQARQTRVEDLTNELDRWSDDAYVITQARQRFTFVFPGEVGYVVLDEPRSELERRDPSAAAALQAAESHAPWYATLWGSVQEADQGASK